MKLVYKKKKKKLQASSSVLGTNVLYINNSLYFAQYKTQKLFQN